jgi:glycosyltransferase involved in cell wall biosynthesis
MKVAWLCPYPLDKIGKIPVRHKPGLDHSATWIVNLSQAITRFCPDIEIDILTENVRIQKSFRLSSEHRNFHVLRSVSAIPLTMRGFPRMLPLDVLSFFFINRLLLIRELKRIKPDLVHAHGTEASYGLAAVSSSFPAVISIQGIISELIKYNKSLRYRLIRQLERRTVQKGRFFIAKTGFAHKFIASLNPNSSIFNIENPVSDVFFSVERYEQPERLVMFVGTITKEKGIEDLVEALARIENTRLKIIGSGNRSYIKQVQERVERLGLDRRVDWLGPRSSFDIAKEFERAAVLVLPSYMETSPNVVMEAMSAGVPVIATAIGGIPDIVDHGITGLLVSPRNPVELADAIKDVLSCPQSASDRAMFAKEEARRRFSSQLAAQNTVAAYYKILELQGRGGSG